MRPGVKGLPFLLTSTIALWIGVSLADDNAFDCHVSTEGHKFDLTKLGGEHIVNLTLETPPTQTIDSLRFDLCGELKRLDKVPDEDQCLDGTRACLTIINEKKGKDDRILSVISVAQSSTLSPSYSVSTSSPKSLTVTFRGSEYPPNSTPVQQYMDMTLVCDQDDTKKPELVSYNQGRAAVKWLTPAGCPLQNEGKDTPEKSKPGDDGGEPPTGYVGSGIGWFFLMLLFAFVAYFAIGAYYNYSTYGARGLDLLPHRDFWQEVPYMFRDVLSHLCSDVGARRASRSGYIAV
ncbi:Autophagy-related protein 27 [Amanita muscaria]